MKIIHIILSSLLLLMIACNSDEFLDKLPKDQLTKETAFISNINFETYAWSFYSTFPGYEDKISFVQELGSDLMENNAGVVGDALFWKRKTVPASDGFWNSGYSRIRNINVMLDNIDGSSLTDPEKDHWRSVGYFFRSYEYIKLLCRYGGVPLVDSALSDADKDILYAPRASRDETSQFILKDLNWALDHINPKGNGVNTINTNTVLALLSRFGLIEGTWRKYHSLSDKQTYLQVCIAASEKLMIAYPALHNNYDEVFNSVSLKGVPGIILYKAYDELDALTALYAYHNRSSIGNMDLTKKAVDMYLCTDGQTIFTSKLFSGDRDAYNEFRNRDRRLYYNTVPPFRVDKKSTQGVWEYLPDPKYREYIDLMFKISDKQHKVLPIVGWTGLVVGASPHFSKFNEGYGYSITYSGYPLHKFYNALSMTGNDYNDAPIFRMGEVLLNYAEAKFELGAFDQTVANATINKLRARANVANLVIANIVADPSRDSDVDPVLWEIRRERAVELIAEGFGRAFDIKRWKKLVEYGAKEKNGRWIKRSDYGNKIPVIGGGTEGYVQIFGVPPGVPESYYLEPIPSDQIVLNPKLAQNPGWE